MSTPTPSHRAATPPVAPTPELLVARFRGYAGGLFWSALVLIAVTGAFCFFYGNVPLDIPMPDTWLVVAASALVLLCCVVPFFVWLSRSYTITTRRVIVKSGLFARHSTDISHMRGYTISLRRGILQRLWRAGTITLRDGLSAPLVLKNVPDAALVHEVLSDQVEASQIQAHRDSQGFSFGHNLP
ncbi:MAG: PH domain-containing protein [Microbacterium sp.]